jgi:ADP-heptose:LPS heptosyltransferase
MALEERDVAVGAPNLSNSPKRLLLIKAHSAGIGDLLRSSAAWGAIKARYPKANLHLWFLSNDPGSPSEALIARHHLLSSFSAIGKRARGGLRAQLKAGKALIDRVKPDAIIDFEPNGLRTSFLTFMLGRRARAATWGIAQVPFRGVFYRHAAPSVRAYAIERRLTYPLEYTERDFVALAGMRIERMGRQIELKEFAEGTRLRREIQKQPGFAGGAPVLGLNIGCGTPGALSRRPDLDLLAKVVGELRRRHNLPLLLTGAPYEAEVNQAFARRLPPGGPIFDLAGKTGMPELTGAISACRLFISADSGPYHMSVGLRVPTLAIFNAPNHEAYHENPWTRWVVAPTAASSTPVVEAAEALLASRPPPPIA